MPFVAVRDLQMCYEMHETGPRLLTVSGTGGDLRRSPNIFEMPIARHWGIALRFAEAGAKLIVNDVSESDAHHTVEAIKTKGGQAVAVIGSVALRQLSQEMGISGTRGRKD